MDTGAQVLASGGSIPSAVQCGACNQITQRQIFHNFLDDLENNGTDVYLLCDLLKRRLRNRNMALTKGILKAVSTAVKLPGRDASVEPLGKCSAMTDFRTSWIKSTLSRIWGLAVRELSNFPVVE